MKTKRLLFAVACLVLLTGTGYTQPTNLIANVYFAHIQHSETNVRNGLRSQWDNRDTGTMAIALLHDADVRAAWGVSDEQYEYIRSVPRNYPQMLREHPAYQEVMTEMRAARVDPSAQNVDVEAMDRFLRAQQRMSALSASIMSDAINNALTSEQRQKMGEAQLSMMGHSPIVSLGTFEVLHLDDTQREQMEEIKRELEPEYERYLDDDVRDRMFMQSRFQDELEKQGGNTANAEEMQKRLQAVREKLMQDPEIIRVSEEMQSRNGAFATQFRTRIFDVLTDEQWERLQYLVDNPPLMEVYRGRFEAQGDESGQADADVLVPSPGSWQPGWVPGPDSWRPGMPIPEEYRQRRNTQIRFPRPAN